MKKRSQLSAELIIIISLVMIIFSVLVFAAYKNSGILNSLINEKYAKKQANYLAQELNTAYLSGNGYSKQISLPLILRTGQDYNLTINDSARLVIVEWDFRGKRAYSYPLLSSNISGSLVNIDKSLISISNQNMKLVVS